MGHVYAHDLGTSMNSAGVVDASTAPVGQVDASEASVEASGRSPLPPPEDPQPTCPKSASAPSTQRKKGEREIFPTYFIFLSSPLRASARSQTPASLAAPRPKARDESVSKGD